MPPQLSSITFMNYINVCRKSLRSIKFSQGILSMKTERLENSNFKFSNRGFLVALAASSMLLMNSFNSMGKYSAGLKEITFVPKLTLMMQ